RLPAAGGGRRAGGGRARGHGAPGDRLPRHRHAAPERDRGVPPAALGPRHRRGDDRDADRRLGRRRPARRAGRRRRPFPHQALPPPAPAAPGRPHRHRAVKLGVHIGYWGLGLTAPQQLALVQEAERLGYDSVWTAEAYGSDAATILAWLAQATTRIKL